MSACWNKKRIVVIVRDSYSLNKIFDEIYMLLDKNDLLLNKWDEKVV